MKLTTKIFASAFATAMVSLTACKGVPDYVIAPSKMAKVLADVHTAEAVAEMGHGEFSSDSGKMALKQAVYDSHNIDAETFDTSLMWYAHHINKYIEVYDKTIEILEKRSAMAGNLAAQEAMSIAGDSVDIWGGSRYASLSSNQPSGTLSFDISADDNWERGDIYVWRYKVVGNDAPKVRWGITANYADSTLECFEIVTSQTGWNEVVFYADSTLDLSRLRGFSYPTLNDQQKLWIDSISLVRRRVVPGTLNTRFRQRRYNEIF